MSVSIKDVAQLANVSTSTVSHVINKTRNVNPETREKVQIAIDKLNYNVNPIARTLRSGNSKLIGYIVAHLSTFFLDIGLKMEEILQKEGYQLIYLNSNEDKEKEKENIKSLVMHNIDGLIIAPVDSDCSYMNQIIGNKCPSVFLDRKPFGYQRDCVMSTNFQGAFEGTKVLLERGHKRIGFVGSHFDITMNERFEGFRSAITKKRIPFNEDLVKFCNSHNRPFKELKYGECYEVAKDFIENKKVDAFFCGNDITSIGVLHYLKEKGLRIPEDIDIVCFDDTVWLPLTYQSICAVDQDWSKIGYTVSNKLLDRINNTNEEPYSEIRIPTKLIIR